MQRNEWFETSEEPDKSVSVGVDVEDLAEKRSQKSVGGRAAWTMERKSLSDNQAAPISRNPG
jgi:4'-phosphopantetheinyl transferase EntD